MKFGCYHCQCRTIDQWFVSGLLTKNILRHRVFGGKGWPTAFMLPCREGDRLKLRRSRKEKPSQVNPVKASQANAVSRGSVRIPSSRMIGSTFTVQDMAGSQKRAMEIGDRLQSHSQRARLHD